MVRSGHANQDKRSPALTREQVIELLRAHRAEFDEFGVKRITLFGSVARDDLHHEGDVDMIVDFSPVTYRRFVALKAFLESVLGKRVDLLTPPAVHGRLKEEIEKDLVDVPR